MRRQDETLIRREKEEERPEKQRRGRQCHCRLPEKDGEANADPRSGKKERMMKARSGNYQACSITYSLDFVHSNGLYMGFGEEEEGFLESLDANEAVELRIPGPIGTETTGL